MSGEGPSEYVQIFAEGSFIKGDLTWGWQCFRCRDEETGFGSATAAGEGRDAHASLDCLTTASSRGGAGREGKP